MDDVTQWIALIVLILLSSFFSATETALTTVNKIKIRSLAENGNKRAQTLMKVHEQWPKMLSTILVGNNIVNIAASSLATILAMKINLAVGIMTGIMTITVLIFGEITPKNIATAFSEPISLGVAGFIWAMMFVFTPIVWVINKVSALLVKILRIDLSKADNSMSEEELRTIVDVSHEDGVIESDERTMINNVFDFGDSRVRDIMTPRIDVTEIEINSSFEEIAEIFARDRFTRLPVYAEDTDNIVGVLNMKDVFLAQKDGFKLREHMREGFYTYELRKTSDLLMDMRKSSVTMAIVLNEYGAAVGIVTIEDLIEEIVGEIRDEYDEDEMDLIHNISKTEYDVDGSVKLDDFNDALGTKLDSEDYDTVGGYMIELLDHVPEVGDSAETEQGIKFEVLSASKKRVGRIYVKFPEDFFEEEKTEK
ncbi:MAG: hemolysin family protein [Lachnospiraceae bacterium]|nr:hemolysin family protein [Lachnospiraceae bacterium]